MNMNMSIKLNFFIIDKQSVSRHAWITQQLVVDDLEDKSDKRAFTSKLAM